MADPNERGSFPEDQDDLNAENPIDSSNAQSNAQSSADEADPIFPPEPAPASNDGNATEGNATNGNATLPTIVGEEQNAETDEERAAREAEEELLWIFQATVFDPNGQKIGRVGQVYLDDQTQAPNWVTVKTGLFGMKEFFIPLDNAERQDKRITVPYSKETVLAAPRTEIDQNLSPSEEDALYNHYQVEGKTTEVVSLEDEASVIPGLSDAVAPVDAQGQADAQGPIDWSGPADAEGQSDAQGPVDWSGPAGADVKSDAQDPVDWSAPAGAEGQSEADSPEPAGLSFPNFNLGDTEADAQSTAADPVAAGKGVDFDALISEDAAPADSVENKEEPENPFADPNNPDSRH